MLPSCHQIRHIARDATAASLNIVTVHGIRHATTPVSRRTQQVICEWLLRQPHTQYMLIFRHIVFSPSLRHNIVNIGTLRVIDGDVTRY